MNQKNKKIKILQFKKGRIIGILWETKNINI